MNYVPLHVHSDCSSDGAGTVQSLVAEAKRLGMKTLALTDHGTLGNAVAFWSACDEAGIKPIMGMEAYFEYNAKRHHLTILALNERGFNNLIALDSHAHAYNYVSGYPLVNMNSLGNWREGLFVLSGCLSSPLYEGTEDQGRIFMGDLVDTMGKNFVGMEVQFLGTHDTWSRPLNIADYMHIEHYITNDTHYPCRHQFPAHQAITKSRKGYTYDSEHLWLKSADEICHEAEKWVHRRVIEGGMENTMHLADFCDSYSLKAPPSLPHIEGVEENLREHLVYGFHQDVAKKGKAKTRKTRLEYEWNILKTKGFLDYIYILWDIVSWAKSHDIRVGPARGSGGGSYLLYLLGVTTIDPIEHGLLFERFINPSRSDYPDVDVDFEADRRSEVMDYAAAKWNTTPIATYSCYSHRSAIHDIARVLTIPKYLENLAADAPRDSEDFASFINDKADALVTYNTMLGQIRHRGKHAAGVVIANRPVPLERAPDGTLVAAWAEGMNTKDLSKVGIVKYDLLGLTALSMLKRMEELSGERWDGSLDDSRVFDLFGAGDVSGIFQWSGSDGIRLLTMRVAPRNFYDLTTCNALYRPGALDAGTAEDYPKYMREPRLLHPRIDPHLESTYGVICYQEQVMAVVAEVMGGDLAQADIARRLISKAAEGDPKWEKEIEQLHIDFHLSGKRQGFGDTLLDSLWKEIYTHSGYSYNLSHASAYTMISYQMAWYKVYHRAAFTTAVLQYDKTNAQTYILDAIEHGLKVAMPSVNYSGMNYELVANTIILPLSDINFLGEKASCYIVDQRNLYGDYASYEEFGKRIPKKTCNNRAKAMLERIGAFRDLEGDPSSIIDKYDEIPVTDLYQSQLEVLGYVVPSPKLLSRIKALAEKPAPKTLQRYAGFISKIEKKTSKHGPYTVFTLSPSGSFWTREPRESMQVGTFVSGTKNTYGHSKDTKTYRLTET